MLSRLQVRNYVLIDSLEIDFPKGLIIITGQTGAGKSILMGALGLLMGAKADASMLSEGADNCVVEAEFDSVFDNAALMSLMEDNDLDWDGGHIIIRRVVNRTGRSRAFVNDAPVSVQVLQDLSSHLIDIHSQHQTLLLSDKAFQMDTLDHFASAMEAREECMSRWNRLKRLKTELNELDLRIAKMAGEKEYNEAQYVQLEAASLCVGELAELEEEQKQLANAEEIKTCLCAVEEMFSSNSYLREAEKLLSKVGRFVQSASSLSERVEECRRELDDILSDVEQINSRTELSQSRLDAVEERMSLIYGLLRKHDCADESELIALRDSLSNALVDSTFLEEKHDELVAEIEKAESELKAAADRLHKYREGAAQAFAEAMTQSVRNLELPLAVFEVDVIPATVGPTGADTVQFRFSATGRNAVDVAKCASGGELSRIMLALKALRARYTNMPTMVFDEIDTGVSGSVADKMGSMICDMGDYMQVFAITHLPQVAAKGRAHYLVAKDIDSATSNAVTTIKKLSHEERVLEVARMLSGSVLTDAAVANAEVLLGSTLFS